jgi:hypothetical protein
LEAEIVRAEQHLAVLRESKADVEKRRRVQLENNDRAKLLREEEQAANTRAEERRLTMIRHETLRKSRLRNALDDKSLPDWKLPRQSYRDDT